MVSANAGYGNGIHAPGIRDHSAAFAATHHLLLGHGLAVERLRAAAAPQTRIGIALNQTVADSASHAPSDVAAARRVDGNNNRMYLDPVLLGRYPEDMMRWLRDRVDVAVVSDGDLEVINRPIDYLGVNYYRRSLVRAVAHGENADDLFDAEVVVPDDIALTAVNWPVQPDGLRDLLVHIRDEYPTAPPLLVTENGAAFDEVVVDGEVDDPQRVAYLRAHIAAVREAIDKGVDVRGYFIWSLLDNFEWAEGYTARFGIVYVDYATQQRIPKSSARWLRDFLAEANGAHS
jgi:beta-glucosidase